MNDASKQFAAQSLVAVLVLNGILLAAIHFLNADVPMNPAATYGAGAALSSPAIFRATVPAGGWLEAALAWVDARHKSASATAIRPGRSGIVPATSG